MQNKWLRLRKLLEKTHAQFVVEREIQNDALAPALRYRSALDREFAAFVCAILAYGKVAHIKKSVDRILLPMGNSPVAWLKKASVHELNDLTKGWSHRFNTSSDMTLMLSLLKQVYETHSSLESFVAPQMEETAEQLLGRLVDRLSGLSPAPLKRFPKKGASFWFLLPRPSSGSACKRLNLFLRWMVGQSEMDLALWSRFSRSNLIVPVDVHLLRQAQALGLTKRKAADWQTALEITEGLKNLDRDDPTRFDFALCHLGINGKVLSFFA